jgi:hypothetical protein
VSGRVYELNVRITVADETAVRAAALASTARLVQGAPDSTELAMDDAQNIRSALLGHISNVLGEVMIEGRLPGVVEIGVSWPSG